jgi:predicted nucleic acid-binding protein
MVDPKRYIDTNIFVYWLGDHPKFGEAATHWIKKIEEAPQGQYFTCSLSIYQTLVVIGGISGKNLKDKGFVEEVITSLTRIKGLSIEPLRTEDFMEARDLMNDCKLDYEDALHLAVATKIGAQEIVTNDEDFDKTKIKRIM